MRGVKDSMQHVVVRLGTRTQPDRAEPKDERIRQAWDTWSQCVVDKGLGRYENPDKAFEDKAWQRGSGGNTTRTERELATATADVECKRKHDTVRVWWEVRAEMQRADVERNKARYEAVRAGLIGPIPAVRRGPSGSSRPGGRSSAGRTSDERVRPCGNPRAISSRPCPA